MEDLPKGDAIIAKHPVWVKLDTARSLWYSVKQASQPSAREADCRYLHIVSLSKQGVAMTFKANLLQKIEIDTLAHKVIQSWGPPDSGRKIDKDTMRSLLEIGDFRHESVREMDLYYLREEETEQGDILVLDNELPIYHTSEADVAMRRNPTIKEMISIRNAIKILSDSDVVVSKKDESVRTVQRQLLDRLDLSFGEADIDGIAADGIRSLEREYTDGVVEALTLFAELLDYRKAPQKAADGSVSDSGADRGAVRGRTPVRAHGDL